MRIEGLVVTQGDQSLIVDGLGARNGSPPRYLPGQNGQASPAALSQTVKMKSIFGAPGTPNTSQLLELKPSVEIPCSLRTFNANGVTTPFGWLPAE